jgi:hypothetical protein
VRCAAKKDPGWTGVFFAALEGLEQYVEHELAFPFDATGLDATGLDDTIREGRP